MMESMFSLTSIGLAYDGFGVAILGYAFFSTRAATIFLNSRTFYRGNRGMLQAGMKTRTDGITGTILLVIGFILQLLGAHSFSLSRIGQILLGLLFLFLVCYGLFIRTLAVKYQLKKAAEFEKEWKAKSS